ncbi:MAG TPA: alpha/beta hydrolase [Candidatus Thioglobus sp.]|nr:alpha/beta hydrolase [Candidatus Thioglobus sp.]
MITILNKHKTFAATGGCVFDKNKPVVVFVHGSGLDHRCWALQSRWFAFHGYSVFAPDLPGHGLSAGEPLSTIEATGRWLVKALNTIEASSIHLVGHSAGFLVALEAVGGLGDRLKTLTAVASSASIPVSDLLITAAESSAAEGADFMLRWGFGSQTHAGISAVPGMQPIAIARQIISGNPLATDFKACHNYCAGESRISEINIPSHVILASEDKMTPIKFGLELASSLRARITQIDKTGHMLPIESPKRTLDAIKAFIIEHTN